LANGLCSGKISVNKKRAQEGVDMSDDTYEIAVVCENCDFKGKTKISKGKMVKDTACPKCGNKTLRKALSGEVT
jgi:hypothetical protein